MPLSFRARVIDAAMRGAPSQDVRRLAHLVHYLPASKCSRDGNSPQAARDGVELVKTLSLQSKNPARPAPHWKRVIRREYAGPQALSERATGVLEEAVKVMGYVKAVCRRAVFGRRVLTFRFQGRYLGAAKNLRGILVLLLRMAKPLAKGVKPAQGWRPTPGCPNCSRHVVFVVRGVTQLARRLKTLDISSRS